MFAGMALGPFGFQLLDAGPGTEGYTVLAQLALALILFNQAAELRLNLDPDARPGDAATAGGRHPADVGVGHRDRRGGAAGAAVVGGGVPGRPSSRSTEAALIEALLKDSRIPERVRHALSVESGFYDGFALAVLLIALGLASQEETGTDQKHWAWFIFSTEIVSFG